MDIILRESKKADLLLVKQYTVETAWTTFAEDEKKLLDRKMWKENFLRMFERARAQNRECIKGDMRSSRETRAT